MGWIASEAFLCYDARNSLFLNREANQLRATRAEIDLTAVQDNVRAARRAVGPVVQIVAVVKADAYGHGAVPVARAVLASGADRLAVALPEEGVALRRAGLAAPILVLGPTPPEAARAIVRHGLEQAVADLALAEALSRRAAAGGGLVPVHLKVDTGMARLGFSPKEALPMAMRIAALPGIELVGLMTHLATADAPDPGYAREQLRRFTEVSAQLAASGIRPTLRHAANSAAVLRFPQAHLDMVRPGLMLYGCPPVPEARPLLRPALRLRTEVAALRDLPRGAGISYGLTYTAPRDMRVATLPIGYADGFSRLLSNRGEVLVGGRRAPVVGRVCMDMIMVDVTDVPDIRVGAEAVLLGRQGREEIAADELADRIGTVSYEVLCGIGKRVPRVYRRGQCP